MEKEGYEKPETEIVAVEIGCVMTALSTWDANGNEEKDIEKNSGSGSNAYGGYDEAKRFYGGFGDDWD